jgi:hypothetical protein
MPARPGFVSRFFTGLWNVLDFARRLFFNIVFLVIVGVLLFAWMAGDRPPRLAADTALVINLQGDLVEEQTIGAREAAVAELLDEQRSRDSTARRCARDRRRCPRFEHFARGVVARSDGACRAGVVARDWRRARAVQGNRQAGIRVGRELQPEPVLPGRACQRVVPASGRIDHGARDRRAPWLLQRAARQSRGQGARIPGGAVQDLRRAVHADRPVAGGA